MHFPDEGSSIRPSGKSMIFHKKRKQKKNRVSGLTCWPPSGVVVELLALESADEVEGLLLIPIPPFRLKLTSKEILLVWTVSGWLTKNVFSVVYEVFLLA